MAVVRIFQNFYNDEGRKALDRALIPYYNHTTNKYFCGQVLVDLIGHKCHLDSDYFAVLSWKICLKSGRPGWWIKHFVETDAAGLDYYVPVFFRELDNVWQQGEAAHPGIIAMATTILSRAGFNGLDLLTMPTPFVLCNYQVVQSLKYEQYVREMLIPCMAVMDNDRDLFAQLNRDAGYQSVPTVPADRLERITGLPFYTYHPFIIERLFATFATLHAWTWAGIPAPES